MIEKYGVDNFFRDYEWQTEERERKIRVSGDTWFQMFPSTSKFEKEVVKSLTEEFELNNCFHVDSEKLQKEIAYIDSEGRKKRVVVDFYCPDKKVVIECYGDYWHCNPKIYPSDYYHKMKKKTASEIWDIDSEREFVILEQLGIQPFIVWENDWNKSKEIVLRRLKKILL